MSELPAADDNHITMDTRVNQLAIAHLNRQVTNAHKLSHVLRIELECEAWKRV
jgi:hypothetical protein